jgi:hypothetical protein
MQIMQISDSDSYRTQTNLLEITIMDPRRRSSRIVASSLNHHNIVYDTRERVLHKKMAEEKSHDDDDMTPEERVAWLRDHVSFNVHVLLLKKGDDDDSHSILLHFRYGIGRSSGNIGRAPRCQGGRNHARGW